MIGKTMDGMLIRVKMARAVPAARNRPDMIERRYEYANWFMMQGVINDCIFIDECGYNIWIGRSYGRARVGERAYRQVSGQRGRNVTICLAVSPTNGLVYHTARIGGMNRQLFNEFWEKSEDELIPTTKPSWCLTVPLHIETQIVPEEELR